MSNAEPASTVAIQAHLPALGRHERADVGNELQATLVELVDLALVGKQLHWSVVGSHFRSLHVQLDELVESWRDLGDVVAERAVALGAAPDGQAAAVAAQSALSAVEPGPIADSLVVETLARQIADVAARARERMDRLGDIDAASQDVLTDVVRSLEEQLWMVRAQHAPAGSN